MKKNSSSPLGLYVIGIAALFLAGFLMLVIFGAQIYRNTVKIQDGNNRFRASLSYLSAAVRASDSADAVRIEEETMEDGTVVKVLDLADGDTGFSLRIYCWQGNLIEEYAQQDVPLTPAAGNMVGETDTFEVEKDGAILRVRTDEGEVLLHLRSEM